MNRVLACTVQKEETEEEVQVDITTVAVVRIPFKGARPPSLLTPGDKLGNYDLNCHVREATEEEVDGKQRLVIEKRQLKPWPKRKPPPPLPERKPIPIKEARVKSDTMKKKRVEVPDWVEVTFDLEKPQPGQLNTK